MQDKITNETPRKRKKFFFLIFSFGFSLSSLRDRPENSLFGGSSLYFPRFSNGFSRENPRSSRKFLSPPPPTETPFRFRGTSPSIYFFLHEFERCSCRISSNGVNTKRNSIFRTFHKTLYVLFFALCNNIYALCQPVHPQDYYFFFLFGRIKFPFGNLSYSVSKVLAVVFRRDNSSRPPNEYPL